MGCLGNSVPQAAFSGAGADIVTATHRAHEAVFGLVQQQAAMLPFIPIFQLLGIVTLAVVPLVLLMKRPTGQQGRSRATEHDLASAFQHVALRMAID